MSEGRRVLAATLLLATLLTGLLIWTHYPTITTTTRNTITPDWIKTIFHDDAREEWITWIYDDLVTRRTLLLPSKPHAITAEPGMVRLFNQLVCHHSELFVDIGMNSGFYSLLASVRGCRVLAAEIQPSCIAMMRFAERANFIAAEVEIVQAPITGKDGESFPIDISRPCEGMLSLFWKGTGKTQMLSQTLDTLLPPSRGHVAMLKIDIEGFEPHALAGAKQLLRDRRVTAMLVEATWWPNVFSPLVRAYEATAHLFDHGYTVRCIGWHPVWDREFTSAKQWIDYGASPEASQPLAGDAEGRRVSGCNNYLICLAPCPLVIRS
jgi:FkbM family methyltransferase